MQLFTKYHESPLGVLKIQATSSHVVLIHFVNETGLKNDDTQLLKECITQLDEYFQGKRKGFDLPLGQLGSPFQINVWEHLTKIPFGKTISYLQLSKQSGDVKAIRSLPPGDWKRC